MSAIASVLRTSQWLFILPVIANEVKRSTSYSFQLFLCSNDFVINRHCETDLSFEAIFSYRAETFVTIFL